MGKGSLGGFVIGIAIFIFCLFLAQAVPVYIPQIPASAKELLAFFFLFVGATSIFLGALMKG